MPSSHLASVDTAAPLSPAWCARSSRACGRRQGPLHPGSNSHCRPSREVRGWYQLAVVPRLDGILSRPSTKGRLVARRRQPRHVQRVDSVSVDYGTCQLKGRKGRALELVRMGQWTRADPPKPGGIRTAKPSPRTISESFEGRALRMVRDSNPRNGSRSPAFQAGALSHSSQP